MSLAEVPYLSPVASSLSPIPPSSMDDNLSPGAQIGFENRPIRVAPNFVKNDYERASSFDGEDNVRIVIRV